jgi:hypothetical protein
MSFPYQLLRTERDYLKFRVYIMAPELISVACFINPHHAFFYLCPRYRYRKRLGNTVNATTNTHATIECLLGASFSIGSMLIERRDYGSISVYHILVHAALKRWSESSKCRQGNMFLCPIGLETKNNCDDENQYKFTVLG